MKVLACLSLVILFAGCSKTTATEDASVDVDVVDADGGVSLAAEVSAAVDATDTVAPAADVSAAD